MEYDYNEEPGVNIRNLIYRILRKWRIIIVWMIVGAILLDAFAYFKTLRKAASIKKQIENYQEKLSAGEYDSMGNAIMSLPDFEKSLTNRQISEVNNLISTYKMYQSPYSSMVDYIDNSILMQLDPQEIPTYTLQYLIDTHYTVEYPEILKKDYTFDIIESINPKLLNNDTLTKISKAISSEDNEISTAYIGELITTELENANDLYTITVFGRSEEECELMVNIIKKQMNSVFSDLKKQYGNFDYSLISEEYSVTCNMEILNLQQLKADKLNTTYNSTRGMINNLTDDQKLYFYAILNNEDTITLDLPVESGGGNSAIVDPTTLQIPTPSLINIKYIIVGAAIGFILFCVYIIVLSLLGNRLLTNDEIEEQYSLHPLGIWRRSDIPKGILKALDNWLIRLLDSKGEQFSSEESLEMIAAGIRISSEKNNWNKVFITSTANNDISKDTIETLVKQLKGKIGTVSSGKSIIYDPESLEKLCGSDACVIIEQVDVSKKDEIKSEINLCNSYKIPIIGYATLK